MALFKIIVSTLLGLILALYLVSKDVNFKTIVAKQTTDFFEINFDCAAKLTIDQINFFQGTGTLKNILIKSKNKLDPDWYWECENLKFQIDWLYLLTQRIFKIRLILQNFKIQTYYDENDHNLAIATHLHQLLFTPSVLPIEISNLDIKTGIIEILNQSQKNRLQLNWHSETKLLENILKTNIFLKNSCITVNKQIYLDQLTGQVQINLPLMNTKETHIKSDLHFTLPVLDQNEQCFLKAKYEQGQMAVKLSTLNGAINLVSYINFPLELSHIWQINTQGTIPEFTGNNVVTLQATASNLNHLQGHCKIENWGNMTFARHNQIWTGTINWQKFDLNLPIDWHIDERTGHIDASFDLKLINPWIAQNLPNIFNCEGKLVASSKFASSKLDCTVKLITGNIVLPKVYNAIKDFHTHLNFDFKNQFLKIDQTKFVLHQGQIEIPKAMIYWDKSNFLKYLYLPVVFTNCLVNYNKQFSSCLSGKVLYEKKLDSIDCFTGFITLEQTLCKYNLLAGDLEKLFNETQAPQVPFSLNPIVDLNIFTLSPLKIQSESLETNALAQLHLVNHIFTPEVTGEIKLIGGKIIFPYKPLYITHGHLHFTAEQSHSPIINLSAKNRIKHHNITMQINGSVSNPQINLESSPSLTNEEIGALLLVGSEKSALNQIIFGSNQVKFIPSFNDESGHPAITGAVEIEVGDRLHASIKKNFSLQEDTKFEVDYAITDDVSIRGIKDERGDLGGEIEIRLRI